MSAPYLEDITELIEQGRGRDKHGSVNPSSIAEQLDLDYTSVLLSIGNGISKGYFKLELQ